MKSTLFVAFVVILLLFVLASKAQRRVLPVQPFSDTSVLHIVPPQLTYKGNSNQLDIYTATPDNMYVIKPDSTIRFNMPTGNYTIMQSPVGKPKKK